MRKYGIFFKKNCDFVPASNFSSKVYMYVVPELQKYKIRKAGYSQSTDKITHCSTIEVSMYYKLGVIKPLRQASNSGCFHNS